MSFKLVLYVYSWFCVLIVLFVLFSLVLYVLVGFMCFSGFCVFLAGAVCL